MNEFVEKKSENIIEDIINEVEERISNYDFDDAIRSSFNLYEGIDDIALSKKELKEMQKFYTLIAKRNREKERRKERILQNEEDIRIIIKPVTEIPKEDFISGLEDSIIQQIALRNIQKEKEVIEIPKIETQLEKLRLFKAEKARIKAEKAKIKAEKERKILLESSKAEQERIEKLKLELKEKVKEQKEKEEITTEKKEIIRAAATIIDKQIGIIAAAKEKIKEQNKIIKVAEKKIKEQNLIETRIIEIKTEIKTIIKKQALKEQAKLIEKGQKEMEAIKAEKIKELIKKWKG